MIAKALKFAALVPKRPTEALDRLSAVVQSRREAHDSHPVKYDPCGFRDALLALGRAIKTDLLGFLAEPQLSDIESAIEANWMTLSLNGPFQAAHNADAGLGRLCYCLTRAIRPMNVVETGVCYGVTSSFALQALDCNSKGHLHSIDLPPLRDDADRFVGRLIPGSLRDRWSLHRGSSRRLLAPLLKSIGTIDMFIHDSLHTYRNMKMEMSLAWKVMRPGGVLIADDVQGNRAFQELTESVAPTCSIVLAEQSKSALCGVLVKRS
jgi:predicted O-methyltransferase YrrM